MNKSAFLLIAVGLLLAVNIALARAAHDVGLTPLLIALVATAGAGTLLLALAFAAGRRPILTAPALAFYAVAGGISYALPNLLVFGASGKVSPAFATMLHAVVPSLTYLTAIAWGLDRLAPRRGLGLALGLSGAVTIIAARLGFNNEAEAQALLLALIAPLSIALGNVVRSRFWPEGAEPLDVAPGMLLIAGAELGLVLLLQPTHVAAPAGPAIPILAALLAVSAVFYALYFRLQHVAGPVYLSQIGYVGTVFAVPIAVLIFGDRVSPAMLGGVALVILGVFLVRPRQGDAPQSPERPAPVASQGVGS